MAALIERDGCIFDSEQLPRSHGYQALDPIGREAFVNHVHFGGAAREAQGQELTSQWARDMRTNWPDQEFVIYVHRNDDENEVIVRFHRHRPGEPDWCAPGTSDVEVRHVGPSQIAAGSL